MATSWLVNGAAAAVDPGDRGLAYGDGLFETMAVLDGAIRRLDLHLDRLTEGCRRLAAPGRGDTFPPATRKRLEFSGFIPGRTILLQTTLTALP